MQPEFDVLIVGGFGHVGLPLGLAFADAGLQVALHDIDGRKRQELEAGRMPFLEPGAQLVLERVLGKTLHLADGLHDARRARVVVVTIGTPIDEYLNPRTGPILDFAAELAPHFDGQTVVIRSTVYPGTTRCLEGFFARRGVAANLAVCPERIVQGHALEELRKLPQIVSGTTPRALDDARRLFGRLGVETVEVGVEEAELAKLFCNAWRYIQFAIANQFYMFASSQGVDYAKVDHAMRYHYERAGALPRPGFAAGPCLLKDTMQLSALFGHSFELGAAAMRVNEGLPHFLVEQLRQARGGDIAGLRVGILGMAFKAETDDTRDALSFKLRKLLRFHGATVACSDEHARDPSFVSKEELLRTCDIVVVGVPHAAYRGLEVPPGVEVVDLWGVTRPALSPAGAAGSPHPASGPRQPPTRPARRRA